MLKIVSKSNSIKFLLSTTFFILCLCNANTNAQSPEEAEKLGKEIFEKYQTAMGGKDNLDKIRTVETVVETEMMGTKKKETRIEDRTNKPKTKYYSVTEGGIEGKQESGFDGTRTWIKSNMFRGYRENTVRISGEVSKHIKLPNETIDGKEHLVLEEIRLNSGAKGKSYYDPNTFLLAQRKIVIEVAGNTIEQANTFAGYRKVGDVLVPFSETIKNSQGITISRKTLSVRHNIEVDPKIFEFNDETVKKDEKTVAVQEKPGVETKKQSVAFKADANTVYKDEDGKIITQAEFFQKRSGNNYMIEPEISEGKMVGLRLKKGSSETAVGSVAKDFNGILLNGSNIQLNQFKGKVVVLNFWFVECAPCIKEIPELNDLVKKYKGKDVEFLAITYNEKAQITEFLKKRQFDYKIISDAQNVIDLYKTSAYPTHIVLNKEGKIEFTQYGYSNKVIEQMTKSIDSILELPKPEWDMKNPEAVVPESVKKETFEKVWTTINDTYFDQTFNGVDWKLIKTKYEPQLAQAKTNQNLSDLLNKMLGELKVSHLKVVPANQVSISGNIYSEISKKGSIGVDLRLLNKSELIVTNVSEKSPAELAGIKKGYIIKKIDGKTIEEIVTEQKQKGGFQLRDEIVAVRTSAAKLLGDLDKKVLITVVDENNQERTLEISRQNFGVSRDLNFESKELNADFGYIKFNIFMGDLPKKFEEAITAMKDKKAVIIDLRGNPGGVGNQTTAIAGMLDKEKRSLGVSQYRYAKQQFEYEGNDKSYQGKVFILLDELSGSSSEVLAGGLQANKRAIVIGQSSAGAVLPSTIEVLPNGEALQYAVADFKTPDGKILEGKGVTPDIEVKLTREDLFTGQDALIEKALNSLHK